MARVDAPEIRTSRTKYGVCRELRKKGVTEEKDGSVLDGFRGSEVHVDLGEGLLLQEQRCFHFLEIPDDLQASFRDPESLLLPWDPICQLLFRQEREVADDTIVREISRVDYPGRGLPAIRDSLKDIHVQFDPRTSVSHTKASNTVKMLNSI